MSDCRHYYYSTKDDNGDTYCRDCNEYLMIIRTARITVSTGEKTSDGSRAQSGFQNDIDASNGVNLLSILQTALGVARISVKDVIFHTNTYFNCKQTAIFSIGADSQYLEADLEILFFEDKKPTGRFYEPPVEVSTTN